ncbi:hypothetical protein Scep_023683 [Stephania cephalantha]|uniref:Uncharacterized protein n=1 Tax=Stephania cephalantha TaxID=152367 RepID=A0AAP0F297_9MAGN
MAYASRLIREQFIASSSFVEVATPCPLLLSRRGSIGPATRHRAVAPLRSPRAAAAAVSSLAFAPFFGVRRAACELRRPRAAAGRRWTFARWKRDDDGDGFGGGGETESEEDEGDGPE